MKPNIHFGYLAFAILVVASIAAPSYFIDSPRNAEPEVQFLIPFADGACYKLSNGQVVVQVEIGLKDGMKLKQFNSSAARFMLTNERPLKVSGNWIECPLDTMPWPEHPPLLE